MKQSVNPLDLIIGEADKWKTLCSDGVHRIAITQEEKLDMIMDKLNQLIQDYYREEEI